MDWEEEIKSIIPKKDKRLIYIEEIGDKIKEELKEYDLDFFITVHYPEKKISLLIDWYMYRFSLEDVLRLELNKKMNTEEAVRYIVKEKLRKRFNFISEVDLFNNRNKNYDEYKNFNPKNFKFK